MQRSIIRNTLASGFILAGAATAVAQDAKPVELAPPPPPPQWESSVNLGLSYTSGNSDTLLVTGGIETQKKTKRDEWDFGAKGAYGKNDGAVNNNMATGWGQYNYLFTDRFYGYARVDALYDGIADIAYRVNLSPGVGYYLIKSAATLLSGEVGPGYVFEKKGGIDANYATIRFAERFEQKIGNNAKLWQSVSYLPQITDWGNYQLNAEIGIEAPLVKNLSLRVVGSDTFNSQPAQGKKQNDLMLVGGIAYKF